ncbi:MAG: RdgB/HAM1 family non-canonical purine NTP pyrophosphatase [Hyphomicrobiales bacterium]|nr:RdgB/HAM1 family non-canonical purine NTP pyrophosphatase [Hyphomicrobiales bacterium]
MLPDLTDLVLASHNQGKLREFAELLAPWGVAVPSAAELGLDEPDETGATFAKNALIKARAAARATGRPALADDSGLCVEALGGAPGILSARWAGPSKDFSAAMARIERELAARAATTDARRRAAFVATLALVTSAGEETTYEGRVEGTILPVPCGDLGFGYDPIFRPDGHSRGFGEMTSQEKHGIPAAGGQALSHRARAFQAFAAACLPPLNRSAPPA